MPECPPYTPLPTDIAVTVCMEQGGVYVGGYTDIEPNGGALFSVTWPPGMVRPDIWGHPRYYEYTDTTFPAGEPQGESSWDLYIYAKGEPSVCWWHPSAGIGDVARWINYDNTNPNEGINMWWKVGDGDWTPSLDFAPAFGDVTDPDTEEVLYGQRFFGGGLTLTSGVTLGFHWSNTFHNPPGYDPGEPPPPGCAGWDAPLTTAMYTFVFRRRGFPELPPLLGPSSGVNWPYASAGDPLPPPQGGRLIHFWGREAAGSWGRYGPDQNTQWDTPLSGTMIRPATPATWLPFNAAQVVDMAPQSGQGDIGIAVLASGVAWQWGGVPLDPEYPALPALVPDVSGVIGASGGGNGLMVVESDGTVLGWGENVGNRLGTGGGATVTPQAHSVGGAVQATVAFDGSVVLQSGGSLLANGGGEGAPATTKAAFGAAGFPATPTPGPHYGVSGVSRLNKGGGYKTTTLVSTGGTLLAWGRGGHSELGNGSAIEYRDIHGYYHTTSSETAPNDDTDQPDTYGYGFWNWPQTVVGISGAVDFHIEQTKAIALLSDGRILVWGEGCGPLMDGSLSAFWVGKPSDAPVPWRMPDPPSAPLEVTLCGNAFVVRCADGGVYVAGSYQSGDADPVGGALNFHPYWRRLPGVVDATMIRGGSSMLMILGRPEIAVEDFAWVASQLG